MYIGMALFPQKKVQDIINSYRKRYDPHYSLIPPHITLKEKFDLPEEKLDDAVVKLEAVARQLPAFTIKFHKVSHFHPTSNTIYLAIENDTPIIELHNQIKDVFDPVEAAFAYIPHLTIGQKMTEEELHDVYGSLRMRNFELETKIDRFHLLYQLENGCWNVYQSFQLLK